MILRVDDGRLVDQSRPPNDRLDASDGDVVFRRQGPRAVAVLAEPVAFFIPEHVPDPSLSNAGEQLWAAATIPRTTPPHPIRFGVRKEGGEIVPLPLDHEPKGALERISHAL